MYLKLSIAGRNNLVGSPDWWRVFQSNDYLYQARKVCFIVAQSLKIWMFQGGIICV